jgi:phosphoribosylglycinamide formyltransferase-1
VCSSDLELVVLAGFLRLLLIPDAWLGRVINIHPSLLPAFGGKGCYGHRVHEAVIARGVQFTGCTVHYVTNEYDSGPILLQRCITVRPNDDADTLAARVFEEEKLALPEAIEQHFDGRVRWADGTEASVPLPVLLDEFKDQIRADAERAGRTSAQPQAN